MIQDQSTRAGRRARAIRIATLALLILAGIAFTFRLQLFYGNLGVVDPGRVYRCAQPGANLGRLLDEIRPGSILNLRGGTNADAWYIAEVRAARERGIDFYDIPISAVRRPSRRDLLVLLDLFERCRYPLLIHCKQGADRTGLASGLYLMSRRGESPEHALRAFALAHGHVAFGGPEHLEEPFTEYAAWLRERALVHTPGRLRAWVERDYCSPDLVTALPPTRPGPRVRGRGEKVFR
jgi:hypothetical protein